MWAEQAYYPDFDYGATEVRFKHENSINKRSAVRAITNLRLQRFMTMGTFQMSERQKPRRNVVEQG